MDVDPVWSARGALAAELDSWSSDVVVHDLYGDRGSRVYEDTALLDPTEIRELSRLVRRGSGPILELAAGSGRLTLPLLASRRPVTAVELSPSMLGLLQRKAAELPEALSSNLRLVECDMSRIDLDETFETVVLGTASISLLDAEDRRRLLKAIADHLSTDGRLWLSVAELEVDPQDGTAALDGHVEVTGSSGASYRVHYFWQPGEPRRFVGIYDREQEEPRDLYVSAPAVIDVPLLHRELDQAGFRVIDRHPVSGSWSGFDEYFLEVGHA